MSREQLWSITLSQSVLGIQDTYTIERQVCHRMPRLIPWYRSADLRETRYVFYCVSFTGKQEVNITFCHKSAESTYLFISTHV